jgi:hypothetical protein
MMDVKQRVGELTAELFLQQTKPVTAMSYESCSDSAYSARLELARFLAVLAAEFPALPVVSKTPSPCTTAAAGHHGN